MKSLFKLGLWKTAKTFYCSKLWRMVRKVWEVMKLRRDKRSDGKLCGGRDSGPPRSLALTHPPAPWQALSSSLQSEWFFSACLCAELLLPAVPATFGSPAPPRLTHGSVPSSVPAGVGCFPASVDSGWSRSRSLLSPDGRSTSHCWTSTDIVRRSHSKYG